MHAINHSMRLLVTHSMVSLIVVSAVLIVFALLQLFFAHASDAPGQATMGMLSINAIISIYFGIYFAGGLNKLKQNYLWKVNSHYRNALMMAYLILLCMINAVQLPFLYLNLHLSFAILLLPFCISVFSSQLVLGKNVLYKVLIPCLPLLLLQLIKFGISLNTIMIVIFASCIGVIIAMYYGFLQKDINQQKRQNTGFQDNTMVQSTGLSLKWLTIINHFLSQFVTKSIGKSPSKIDLAVIMPHTKLAIYSLFYLILMVLLASISSKKHINLIEGFAPLFLAAYAVNLVMETTHLIKQTKSFAHTFTGQQQFKNRILYAFDKAMLLNIAVFTAGLYVLCYIVNIELNPIYLLLMLMITTGIVLAYAPLLLCFNWLNINFSLITVTTIYAVLHFYALRWFKGYYQSDAILSFMLIFFMVCALVRTLTQWMYWQQPFEKLLKS